MKSRRDCRVPENSNLRNESVAEARDNDCSYGMGLLLRRCMTAAMENPAAEGFGRSRPARHGLDDEHLTRKYSSWEQPRRVAARERTSTNYTDWLPTPLATLVAACMGKQE